MTIATPIAVLEEVSLAACCVPVLLLSTPLLVLLTSTPVSLGVDSEIEAIGASVVNGEAVALVVQVMSKLVRVTGRSLRSVSIGESKVVTSKADAPKLTREIVHTAGAEAGTVQPTVPDLQRRI